MYFSKIKKMSLEELNIRVKRYNRKIIGLRIASAIIYAVMVLVLFVYLLYMFEFTTVGLFILLIYLLLFTATLSGFESALEELHNIKEEIEITIYNRKEDDKWLKMQRQS